MKPGDLEWTLQARLNTIQEQRARSRAAAVRARRGSARGHVSAIAAILMVGALIVAGTATIFANDDLDAHLCDAGDVNADIAADGFICTYLFNKGQGTDDPPIGELYVKRDAADNLILVTDMYTVPDTGHVDPKLCVDDDTDPINISVDDPNDPDKSCLGGTAADTISEGDALKPAADAPEEGAGLYEVMIEDLVEGTYGTFGMFDVFVDGYTEFSLHFNQGEFSTEAFFQADPPGTKSGTKFSDPNGDGDLTDGVALEGWTINAYADDDGNGTLSATEYAAGAAGSDVTDGSGDYELTLAPGDYIVCEVLTTGWQQTYPTDAHAEAADCTSESGATDLGAVGYAISIASGDELVDNDFGNFELVTKSGTKFSDPDGDGDLTDGVGLPDWTINLYLDEGDGVPGAGDTLADSVMTDADGNYAFTDLGPGTYFVCEASMAGWVQTYPNLAGGEVIDTCDDIAGNEPFGYAFTTESGVDLVDNDFGNFEQAFEGCTPGFWKVPQHHDSWAATGFTTGQTLESVFDVPDSLGLDDRTLLQALGFKGGSTIDGAARILLRAAVAAVLNAAHPGVAYEFTLAEVIADVNAALASGDRATILALASELDAANNAGCPLS
jgi:hypothetical protein